MLGGTMHRRTARTVGAVAASLLVVVLTGCGGGSGDEGGTADDTEASVTLEDLKPTEDHFSREITAPTDRGVPEEYDSVAAALTYDLESMLTASFTDPETWTLTSDEDAVGRVVTRFDSIGDENAADLAGTMLKSSRENAEDGERVTTGWASTFAEPGRPTEAYVFKSKWDLSVDEDERSVTVSGVVWAGYEVGGEPVVVARQLSARGYLQDGGMVGYQLLAPVWGGFYDLCTSVVDGEIAPGPKGISTKAAEALRAEFADQEFRPLGEALSAVAKADGGTADDEGRTERTRTCLAEAG